MHHAKVALLIMDGRNGKASVSGISFMVVREEISKFALHHKNHIPMPKLQLFNADMLSELELPFADEGVRAGFPSPAQDYMENSIDLNRDLVNHPESTFYARVVGDSMVEDGVNEGDILVIDKSLDVRTGDMAVCVVNGEFTVKNVEFFPDHVVLHPANSTYPPIQITEADQFEVWGVVTYVISPKRRR